MVRRLTLLTLVAGCAGDDVPSTCLPDQTTVSVSAERAPVFTWTPACGIAMLTVKNEDGVEFTWELGSNDGTNTVESGVTYGGKPYGTIATEAEPLIPGRNYMVILTTNTRFEGGISVDVVDELLFHYAPAP